MATKATSLTVLLTLLLLLAGAGAAMAAVGDSTLDSCLNAGTASSPCTTAGGLTAAFPVALAPGGAELYVATAGGTAPGGTPEDPTIAIYDRDPATGALTRRLANGCVTKTGSSGACVAAPLLQNPKDIAVAPDGETLYVTDATSAAVLEFTRSTNGSLTLLGGCQASSGTCGPVNGMGTPGGLAISPDSKSVYIRTDGGEGRGTLLTFDRNTTTGALIQHAGSAGCLSETPLANCADVAGISRGSAQLVVSGDGHQVYATGRNDAFVFDPCGNCPTVVPSSGTLASFSRAADGTLTQLACVSSNGLSGGGATASQFSDTSSCPTGNGALDQAQAVAATADGASVYAGALAGVTAFRRDSGSGGLTDAGSVSAPEADRLAAVPDGSEVIAAVNPAGTADDGARFFVRNAATSALSPRAGKSACLTASGSSNACNALGALGEAGSVAVSADSMFVYLTANRIGALGTLHRDFAPVCQPATVDVPFNGFATAPLSCSDPNHDALGELAIIAAPRSGTLGAIDQGAHTVRYAPFQTFSGADGFTYGVTAAGVSSAPASVALNVAGPVVTPTPSATPTVTPAPVIGTIAGRVSVSWKPSTSSTRVKSLKVTSAPLGASITVTCTGKGCPFKRRTFAVKSTSSVDLARAFNPTKRGRKVPAKLRVGAKIEIRVNAPARIGRFFAFKVRAKLKPSATSGCLALTGAKTSCP